MFCVDQIAKGTLWQEEVLQLTRVEASEKRKMQFIRECNTAVYYADHYCAE